MLRILLSFAALVSVAAAGEVVKDDAWLTGRLPASEQAYARIDGARLKQYVDEQSAFSLAYRDHGHPQFWGRIIGTEADAANARWMLEKFRKIGLTDVREQPFDLPPQWMPQSWSVVASAGGKTLALETAQPTHMSPGTSAEGLDLEAVNVGFGTEGDLSGRDLRGKAAFLFSTDVMSRHSTISNGAVKRIESHGAAAIFIVLVIPGNIRTQFYPVGAKVPSFSLGYDDGMAMREMIGHARGGPAPHVKVRLDVQMTPGLKTATIWGTLPGMTDENIMIVAHRDGWFEGANDNGAGVATMLGLAEYFAAIPKEQRRRSITFLGTSGHHDGAAMSGAWLAAHKELFAKTALLINCEHTAAGDLISYNGIIRHSRQPATMTWYVGGSPKLTEIARRAYDAFGVATYADPERSASGEPGRYYQYAPSLQVIQRGLYWHSDHETSEIIPPSGLASVTRAYAKIIADIASLELKELQRTAP